MQERARQLDGKLEIRSSDCGTTIVVVLPVPETTKEEEYRAQVSPQAG